MKTFQALLIIIFTIFTTTLLIGQCFEDPPGSGNFITLAGEPCVNTIITSVAFLRITPDARSAGMGDAGIAVTSDVNAMYYNASKLVFSEKKGGLGLTYTPWLRALNTEGIYLGYLSGFHKIGKKKTKAIGLAIRYFSLGDITYTNQNGQPIGEGNPNEWEINGAFSSKINDNFSIGISGKYIYSNLANGINLLGTTISSGKSGAIDLSISYRKKLGRATANDFFFVGAAISNLGTKITYTQSVNKDFIPTNLGLGIAWHKSIGTQHQLTLTMDANKLLVPTPHPSQADIDGDGIPDYRQVSVIKGAFNSFGDAPGGFEEELRELQFSWGVEYWYDQIIALRAGYFHEAATKGNRKYATIGIGGQYRSIGLNLSYLLPNSNEESPLAQTFRVSVLYDFGNEIEDK